MQPSVSPRAASAAVAARSGVAAVRAFLASDRHVLALLLGYAVVGLAAAGLIGGRGPAPASYYFVGYWLAFAYLVLAVTAGRCILRGDLREGGRAAVRRFAAELRALAAGGRLVPAAVLVLMVVPLFMTGFSSLKNALPDAIPFAWDARLEALDRALHFGTAPWEILHPLLGNPWASAAIDFVYAFWGVVLVAATIWFAFADGPLRRRFFLAYALAWIGIGTLAAFALSSAGPCYFGRVTGLPDPYGELFQYLRAAGGEAPLRAVLLQDYLWDAYAGGSARAFTGISAMPSMHVAMATLFLLAGWRYGCAVRAAALAFAGSILAGSVHLGWHYAVDGYAAIALAALAWAVAGRIESARAPG